jgi:hypothetical protein
MLLRLSPRLQISLGSCVSVHATPTALPRLEGSYRRAGSLGCFGTPGARTAWRVWYLGHSGGSSLAVTLPGSVLCSVGGGVHGCAAGDFLLMHRERWAAVRGYPPVVGIGGVDEYPCYIAMRLGIRQVVLRYPRVVFHQDHARTGRSKVTVTDKAALRESFRRVLGGDLTVLGPEDWGLAGVRLAETSVGRC